MNVTVDVFMFKVWSRSEMFLLGNICIFKSPKKMQNSFIHQTVQSKYYFSGPSALGHTVAETFKYLSYCFLKKSKKLEFLYSQVLYKLCHYF